MSTIPVTIAILKIATRRKLTKAGIYEMILNSLEHNRRAIKLHVGTAEQSFFRLENMSEDIPPLAIMITHYERILPAVRLSGSYTRPTPRCWPVAANARRAVLPTSLPTVDQLENFARLGACKVHDDPFISYHLHDKIDRVLLLCCENKYQLPMVRSTNLLEDSVS
jgi:hypothetical protein